MKTDINARIELAKTDSGHAENLISEYTPFLKALVRNYTKEESIHFDDYFSIALSAFYEAMLSFNPQKGYFISFAKLVVNRKLINLYQSKKRIKEVNFSSLEYQDEKGNSKNTDIPDDKNRYFDDPYRLEIEAIKDECFQFGIDFLKLSSVSPKAEKTKTACQKVVMEMLKSDENIVLLKTHNMLPIKMLCRATAVSRKVIERHRKYIIAVVLIAWGDYPYYLNILT